MTNTNREKLRAHWQEWRGFYIGVAVGVVLAGITLLVVRGALRSHDLRADLMIRAETTGSTTELRAVPRLGADCPIPESTGSVSFNGPVHTVNIYQGVRGHPGFLTRCIETGEVFVSQKAAAAAFGIHERIMGMHLNEGLPLDQGVNFERLGVVG